MQKLQIIGTALVLLVLAIILVFFLRRLEEKADKPPICPSPMPAVMVLYNSRTIKLDSGKLIEILKRTEGVAAQEAKVALGPGMNLTYVLITEPAELTIVINDSPASEQDNIEMANEAEEKKQLPGKTISKLKQCTAHLALAPINHKLQALDEKTIQLTTIDLDLQKPEVQKILKILKDSSQGLVYDCQSDEWLEE